MSNRLKGFLEAASNVAVVVAAVALCVAIYRNQQAPSAPHTAEDLVGKTIDVESIGGSPGARQVVLAISQTCRYCEQEMPFYRTLADATHGSLTVAFPPRGLDSEKFLAERGVRASRVVSAPFEKLRVQGTPTLLIVDQAGKIEHAWIGAQDEERHREIIASARGAQ